MRRCVLLLPLAIALIAPASALGGGWASTGIDSVPAGLRAGEPWQVEIEVLRHARTPLDGLRPRVVIVNDDGLEREFAARPTGLPGVYAAEVRFPTAGRWHYRIVDGFVDAAPHTFPPVTIGIADDPGGGGGTPWEQGIAITAIALLWTIGWAYGSWPPSPARRRRAARLGPAVPG